MQCEQKRGGGERGPGWGACRGDVGVVVAVVGAEGADPALRRLVRAGHRASGGSGKGQAARMCMAGDACACLHDACRIATAMMRLTAAPERLRRALPARRTGRRSRALHSSGARGYDGPRWTRTASTTSAAASRSRCAATTSCRACWRRRSDAPARPSASQLSMSCALVWLTLRRRRATSTSATWPRTGCRRSCGRQTVSLKRAMMGPRTQDRGDETRAVSPVTPVYWLL